MAGELSDPKVQKVEKSDPKVEKSDPNFLLLDPNVIFQYFHLNFGKLTK